MFTYSNLRSSNNLEADILLVNYERVVSNGFSKILKEIVKRKLMIVIDESSRIKSYSAKTTKYLLRLSRYAENKLILSATPAPNSEMEYWGHMTFLDQRIFGPNFFVFRNRYFSLVRGKSTIPLRGLSRREMFTFLQRGYDIRMDPNYRRIFAERMKPYCQFISKRDVLDLPEEIDMFRYVDMTKQQDIAYKEMFKDLVMEIQEQEITVPVALAKLMKCRQVSSGFAYNREGKAIEFDRNPKMEELHEVIEEIGNKKIIIFCQYQWEIEKIVSAYPGRADALFGLTTDKQGAIHRFQNSENAMLVTHPLSGGVGLSFNDCDYCIFFSLSYSFLEYYQCRGRIMRAGKQNKATYIHILANNSLDKIIYEAVKNKEDNQKILRRIIG